MRMPLRLAASALVTSVFGLSQVNAHPAPIPAEEKAKLSDTQQRELEEKLKQLLSQLQAIEAKQAETKKPGQPDTPKPVKPEGAGGLQFQLVPAADPAIALKLLLVKSTDPKVIALTRELLALLEKQSPQKPPAPRDPFKGEVVPDGAKPKPGQPPHLEFKFEGFNLESRKPNAGGVPDAGKGGLLMTTAPAAGASSLKLSADGKTAAVVGADGSITIYDVATGKEQLKFPAKK